MAAGGGNNGNGAASTETGTTTVVESHPPQQAVTPKKPKKRKKSESSDEQSSGATVPGGCTAPDGDGGRDPKQEANKKDRLVWSPKLHGKFVRACNELGVKDAVPMKILRRMKINGITRAQVASHLQKYRGSLSKRKDEETGGNRGDATTVLVVHHTPLDAASPSPPATATAPPPAIPPSVPPSPQSPLETPDTMCQPPNGHSSDHAVAAANLHHQQLQLLLLPPVQHQHCFPPPPLLHQVGAVTITEEKTPSMMQQQAAVAPASQHCPTLVGVEQAAGAPVPASAAENGPPVSMLRGTCLIDRSHILLFSSTTYICTSTSTSVICAPIISSYKHFLRPT
ncbi:uncharacterized protein [Setaria viridis]|uniref:HTH myb-type domain-containing protein n=1 Tax=Setaria viridis TaxID=4556 RepID=A0A4U6U8W1_SETVI|nr:hypothetical protein SEVIR_5G022800v2 [Setaria viridis]